MTEKRMALLLHVINGHGDIKRLIREGMTFKNVGELTSSAVEMGYLKHENGKVTLTNAGLEYLQNGKDSLKKRNKEDWIEKEFVSIIPKLKKDSIFLPAQDELFFD